MRWLTSIFLGGVVVLACFVGGTQAQEKAKRASGSDAYTPTKLEWLVLRMNTRYAEKNKNYQLRFESRPPNDVLIIASINYEKIKDKDLVARVRRLIKLGEWATSKYAKKKKWTWVHTDAGPPHTFNEANEMIFLKD